MKDFFENGLNPLYGRFEDGLDEDDPKDHFRLTGPMSIRMNGQEKEGATGSYGSSCTINHKIALAYAQNPGSVVFLLDLRDKDDAHAGF